MWPPPPQEPRFGSAILDPQSEITSWKAEMVTALSSLPDVDDASPVRGVDGRPDVFSGRRFYSWNDYSPFRLSLQVTFG